MSELLDAALGYARRGFPVFPVAPRGKLPLIGSAHRDGDPLRGVCKGECGQDGHGLLDATIDLERIRAWWTRWPRANIGVRTGVAFDVLDLDGPEGAGSMRAFCAEHGVSLAGVPWVATPGGGWHYYFEPTGLGNRAGLLERVDWRGEHGYIVAGPSVHPSGGHYRSIPPGADRPAWVPAPLRALLEPPEPAPTPRATFRPGSTSTAYARAVLDGTHQRILAAAPGARNDTAFREGFKLFGFVAGGVVDEAQAVAALTDAMAAVGLPRREANTVLSSARARGSKRPRGIPADPPRPKPTPAPGAVLSEDTWTASANGKPLVAPCHHDTPAASAAFPSKRSRELYRTLEFKSRIDDQGRRVQENVSHEHLMRHYGISLPTVERELRRLEQLGYLRRERIPAVRGDGGRVIGKRNRYVLLLDPTAVQNATVEEFTVPSRSQSNIEVAPCHQGGAVMAQNHGTPVVTSNHGEGGGVLHL